MGTGGAASAAPPVFFEALATRKGRGGHIHFRHTGRALRLTANTPDAPILWSLDEGAIARRSVLGATAKRSVLGATASGRLAKHG
jgi:hypothetical protein